MRSLLYPMQVNFFFNWARPRENNFLLLSRKGDNNLLDQLKKYKESNSNSSITYIGKISH